VKQLELFLQMAEKDDNIRAIILEGSMASNSHVDHLSDNDINVFWVNHSRYLENNIWIGRLGDVLVYQKADFDFENQRIHTRLVVYRDGNRIDFSFWPVILLNRFVSGQSVYESYKNGYKVLLDKDKTAHGLPAPTGNGFCVKKPTRADFLKTIHDFWFEAYCVAKFLYRGELWYAKHVENGYMKDFFLQMMIWQHQTKQNWSHNNIIHLEGKRLEKWIDSDLGSRMVDCFSCYNLADTWQSLFKSIELFSELAEQTAASLGFEYPDEILARRLEFIQNLKNAE